ncbi:PIN domain-containing protein [Alysiella crassa]|uniref:Predicted nucleic acid-binding protein, contains PIN domain n=1 Tax=Alysiella crassa TaxID=153491 RepID=A0A376BK59_9NEIS|nr:type II toxin-antitoxin system VapC family toxin [Alysiella crassa]UOP07666.1 type II toxin-antitoxin system VapC family toxin [Alysiella crassa]SSY70101.1 Predicted nucleic acid-binding protein, contains PIN domain [Alysiella crassa]
MANKTGIDTNVLVRYLTQDDDVQAKIASNFLENLTLENQGFINNVVIVELIWVLSRHYQKPREYIAMILDEILCMPIFTFENKILLTEVLHIYKNSHADFSDILIRKINELNGCQQTVTFDKRAYKQAGMMALTSDFK